MKQKNTLSILIIFFNRPKILKENIQQLGLFKPKKIFFAVDGPRNEIDKKLIEECFHVITNFMNWGCEINFFESKINYGCDVFIPRAIDWFFSQVDEGIILEDDCLISKDFYDFSKELLDFYRDVEHVMHISSANFQKNKRYLDHYFFSKYPTNWAWATWGRAWKKFDPMFLGLDDFLSCKSSFNRLFIEPEEKKYWKRFFERLRRGKYGFWDAKWVYSIWKNEGVCITPNMNLVKNIGFGKDATHTKKRLDSMNIDIDSFHGELKHPALPIKVDQEADFRLFQARYKPSLKSYLNKLVDIIFF